MKHNNTTLHYSAGEQYRHFQPLLNDRQLVFQHQLFRLRTFGSRRRFISTARGNTSPGKPITKRDVMGICSRRVSRDTSTSCAFVPRNRPARRKSLPGPKIVGNSDESVAVRLNIKSVGTRDKSARQYRILWFFDETLRTLNGGNAKTAMTRRAEEEFSKINSFRVFSVSLQVVHEQEREL